MALNRAIIDPSTPKWHQDAMRRLMVPTAPTPLPAYTSYAALPPAAEWPSAYASADGIPYFSDGTSWQSVGSFILDELGNTYRLGVNSAGPFLTLTGPL